MGETGRGHLLGEHAHNVNADTTFATDVVAVVFAVWQCDVCGPQKKATTVLGRQDGRLQRKYSTA